MEDGETKDSTKSPDGSDVGPEPVKVSDSRDGEEADLVIRDDAGLGAYCADDVDGDEGATAEDGEGDKDLSTHADETDKYDGVEADFFDQFGVWTVPYRGHPCEIALC